MVLSPLTAFDVVGSNTVSCLHQLVSAGHWQRSVGGAAGLRMSRSVHFFASIVACAHRLRLSVHSTTPSFGTSLMSCIHTKPTTVMLLHQDLTMPTSHLWKNIP